MQYHRNVASTMTSAQLSSGARSGLPHSADYENFLLQSSLSNNNPSVRHLPRGDSDTLSTLSLGSNRFFNLDEENDGFYYSAGTGSNSSSAASGGSTRSRTVAWAKQLKHRASKLFTSNKIARALLRKRQDTPPPPPFSGGAYDENGNWLGLARYMPRNQPDSSSSENSHEI